MHQTENARPAEHVLVHSAWALAGKKLGVVKAQTGIIAGADAPTVAERT